MQKRLFFVLALVVFASPTLYADDHYDPCYNLKAQAKCQCYVQQADYYESKMRNGYKASEYNELEDKKRFFRDLAFSCKAK
jgi:hypothetical protein